MKPLLFILLLFSAAILFLHCDREDIYSILKDKTEIEIIPEKIYIFSSGASNNGNMGGRSGANAICQAAYTGTYSGDFQATIVRALISVDAADHVKDLVPPLWGTLPVYGVHSGTKAETLLKSTWNELWSVPGINTTLSAALNLGSFYWTGSNDDGTPAFQTCLAWTSDNVGEAGYTGNNTGTIGNWMYGNNATCNTVNSVVCMAY